MQITGWKYDSHAIIPYPPFSVAICVYGGDEAEWFDTALESIIEQTIKANEIVIVVDGSIPDTIQNVINKYVEYGIQKNKVVKVIRRKTNQGHAAARQCALDNCTNEIVAVMDADDISVNNRFEQQLKFFLNKQVDIVGGNIDEFIGNERNIVGKRIVPAGNEEILEFMKQRCPFNQMTVMFKKEAVLRAGGYRDWFCNEDYYLWLRMADSGCVMANTGTTLVNVRVGEKMYERRGGWQYFKSESKLQRYMLQKRMISIPLYCLNIAKRFIVQIILPNKIRGWVFQKFAREKAK